MASGYVTGMMVYLPGIIPNCPYFIPLCSGSWINMIFRTIFHQNPSMPSIDSRVKKNICFFARCQSQGFQKTPGRAAAPGAAFCADEAAVEAAVHGNASGELRPWCTTYGHFRFNSAQLGSALGSTRFKVINLISLQGKIDGRRPVNRPGTKIQIKFQPCKAAPSFPPLWRLFDGWQDHPGKTHQCPV